MNKNWIKARYFTAVGLIALMAAFALTMAIALTENADERAGLINQSGRQRMLSQQMALLAHVLIVEKSPEIQAQYLSQLDTATDTFLIAHRYLLNARESQSNTLSLIHYDSLILDQEVTNFIEKIQNLVATQEFSAESALDITVDAMRLLPLLDESTRAFEVFAASRALMFRRMEIAVFILTLVLLALEVIFIFRPMTQQLLKSYEERDQAAKRAEKANEAKTEFLATMSHEIRTPLHCILGMTEILKQKKLDTAALSSVETLEIAADGLLKLVNEILDISKLNAGMMTLATRPTKIRSVIAPVMSTLHTLASRKGIILTTNISVTVPDELEMDGHRFAQILTNLVGNSIKFTDKGHVDVAVTMDGGLNTVLTVRDTGVGIAKEDIPNLFKQFHQLDMAATKSHEGTGLGLAIVKRLVDLMGGKIGISSEVAVGTEIWCNLPFRPERIAAEADATLSKSSILAEPNYDTLSDKRVLIIDDVRTNLLVCSSLLESMSMNTVCCASGASGLEKATTESFDILLIDLHMPGMSGLDCIREIRGGNGRNSQSPILVVTADVGEHVIDDAMSAGADGVITKPFTLAALAGMIIPHLKGSGYPVPTLEPS